MEGDPDRPSTSQGSWIVSDFSDFSDLRLHLIEPWGPIIPIENMQLRELSPRTAGDCEGKKRKSKEPGPQMPINHRSSRPKQRTAWSVSTAQLGSGTASVHSLYLQTCIHYLGGGPAPHMAWRYRLLPLGTFSTVRNLSFNAAIRYMVFPVRHVCLYTFHRKDI